MNYVYMVTIFESKDDVFNSNKQLACWCTSFIDAFNTLQLNAGDVWEGRELAVIERVREGYPGLIDSFWWYRAVYDEDVESPHYTNVIGAQEIDCPKEAIILTQFYA